MKKVTKYINTLNNLYSAIGNQWVDQNSLVLNYAKNSKLVIGGSIALAIGAANPHKIPGDIDLFTNNNDDALNFIAYLTKYLSEKKGSFYRIDVNNETPRVLPGVLNHYRIKVPFWKPICVMTVSKPIRKYFYHGAPVQFYDDVIAAAKEASKIDNKNRLPKEEQDAETVKKFQKWTNAKIQRVSIESVPAEDVQVAPMTNDEIDSVQWWENAWNIPSSSLQSLAPSNREREFINNIPVVTRDATDLVTEYFESWGSSTAPTMVTIDSIPDTGSEEINPSSWIGYSDPTPIAAEPRRLRGTWRMEVENVVLPTEVGMSPGRYWTVESNVADNTLNATYNSETPQNNTNFYDTIVNEANRISSEQGRRGGNVVRVDRNTFEPYISINILTNVPHQSRQVEISADYYRSRMDEAIRRLPLREGESDEELSLRINTIIYYTLPHVREEAVQMADVIRETLLIRGAEHVTLDMRLRHIPEEASRSHTLVS